jgi:hypothetical protein
LRVKYPQAVLSARSRARRTGACLCFGRRLRLSEPDRYGLVMIEALACGAAGGGRPVGPPRHRGAERARPLRRSADAGGRTR